MHRISRRLLAAAVLFVAAACSAGDAEGPQQAGTALPEGHPPITGQAGATADGPGGMVLETVDGGGYTYVRLGADDQEIWVAGPITDLEVGDTVQLVNPMAMGEFTSSALERTFENLYFADGFRKPGAPGSAAHAPGATQGIVEETMNSGGYTYVRVTSEGRDLWLAGPETPVATGDSVGWVGGMLMRGFTSSTLERTFDEILFVNAFTVVAAG